MGDFMDILQGIQDYLVLGLLPVAGALAMKGIEFALERLAETPGVRYLKARFYLIDAVLAIAPAELREALGVNPVAVIVEELLRDETDLNDAQILDAAGWAAEVFDFNIHEAFMPSDLSEAQERLVESLIERLERRRQS